MIIMGLGVVGCAGTNNGSGNNTLNGSSFGSIADDNTPSSAGVEEQNAPSQLYGQDENGDWWFDTSQFDPSKFDGKLYLGGIEVTCPITVESLFEAGLFYEGRNGDSAEEAAQVYETKMLRDDPGSNWHYDENAGHIYKAEDGVLISVDNVQQITVYNPENGDMSLKSAGVGTLILGKTNSNNTDYMLAGLNIEGKEDTSGTHYMDIDTMVEEFGVPCYYDGGFFYYYYGDYSLKFQEVGDQIITATYLSTEYLENYYDNGAYTEYQKVYETLK